MRISLAWDQSLRFPGYAGFPSTAQERNVSCFKDHHRRHGSRPLSTSPSLSAPLEFSCSSGKWFSHRSVVSHAFWAPLSLPADFCITKPFLLSQSACRNVGNLSLPLKHLQVTRNGHWCINSCLPSLSGTVLRLALCDSSKHSGRIDLQLCPTHLTSSLPLSLPSLSCFSASHSCFPGPPSHLQ